jgi:hypothetical protein
MTFCANYSRLAGEQLFGTAKPVRFWLLIEHSGRWQRNAEESLPPAARAAVERLKTCFPRMRLQLIRRNGREAAGPFTGFLAVSREAGSRLFSFSIDRYEDLGALDIERTLRSKPSNRQLALICTHGTHDRCCAKFGNALYAAMRRAAGDDVWQISHIGGCRFAPNVLFLPQGTVYGRVQVDDCKSLVDAARSGRVVSRLLRGRSCYSKPVQAAEYFFRSEVDELGPLQLLHAVEHGAGEWMVAFRRGSDRVMIRVATVSGGQPTFKSCSTTEASRHPEFRLIDCQYEANWGNGLFEMPKVTDASVIELA